jgi:hypothetical protein
MDIKDFYFIYVITGDNYLKSILKNFDHIPDRANVVVITNTPKLLYKQKVKFNLIIEDLESLRSDWSRKNEIIPDIEDEQDYMDQLNEWYRSGYRYPMSIMRYGIKWAVKNNISKFLVAESGVSINYFFDCQKGLDVLNEFYINKKKNLIFGSPFFVENIDLAKGWIFDGGYYDVYKRYVPNLSEITYSEILEMNTESEKSNILSVGFDGHTYGFIFDDIKLIERLFNIWEDIMIRYFELGASYSWAINFEWIMLTISSIYHRYYNTFLCGHNNIITHSYRPEHDFFAIDIKYKNHDEEWKVAKTREEFILINRDKLIQHYGGEQRVKDIVYEYEKIVGS